MSSNTAVNIQLERKKVDEFIKEDRFLSILQSKFSKYHEKIPYFVS